MRSRFRSARVCWERVGMESVEVLVVGAGAAGAAAAVRSAREGARTLLVERRGHPGGTGVVAMHRFICGLFGTGDREPEETLNGGLQEEILEALKRLSPERRALPMGRVWVWPVDFRDLHSVFAALIEAEPGLEVRFGSEVEGVEAAGGEIRAVRLRTPEGLLAVTPRSVVDCSGAGTVIRLSGAAFRLAAPGRRQMAGFAIRRRGLKRVDAMTPLKVPYLLSREAEAGNLPDPLRYTVFIPGPSPGEGSCKISLPSGAGIREATAAAGRVLDCLSARDPVFADARIAEASPEVAEREGLRLLGRYSLTVRDVLGCRKFSDGVVRNAWPVERWVAGKGVGYRHLPPGETYQIPLRCLRSAHVKNLFAAGRNISVSSAALGSTRVMGTCIALGEQAGRAAAARCRFPKAGPAEP